MLFWKSYDQAFVREQDDQWLEDVKPSVNALINFLIRENNGIPVYEQSVFSDTNNKLVHRMSNGLSYSKDDKGQWKVVD